MAVKLVSRRSAPLLVSAVLPGFLVCIFLSSSSTPLSHFRSISRDPKTLSEVQKTFCRKYVTGTQNTHGMLNILRKATHPVRFLDVGASIGSVSLPTALCLQEPHFVLSIEPIPETFQRIIARAKDLGLEVNRSRWHLYNFGLSDEDRKTQLFVPHGRADNAAMSKSTAIAHLGLNYSMVAPVSIHLRHGDNFLKEVQFKPDIIKIDVQGSEIDVVNGLERLLSENRDMIVFAEQDKPLTTSLGHKETEVYLKLKKLGFRAFHDPIIDMVNGKFCIHEQREVSVQDVHAYWAVDLTYWKQAHIFPWTHSTASRKCPQNIV